MRAAWCGLVVVFAGLSLACGLAGTTGTTAPKGAEKKESEKTAPAARKGGDTPAAPDLGIPWSEGTAHRKMIGLTDDEVIALIGKPDAVPVPNQWQYREPKWIKPPEGAAPGTPASGLTLNMSKGRVATVWRY